MVGTLKERVKQGAFCSVQLTIDGLQDILLEIIDMMNDQKNQIENIQNEKADKSDIRDLQQKVDSNKEETDKKLRELEKLINDKNNEILDKINSIDKKADDALQIALDAKNRLDNLDNGLTSEQLESLQHQLQDLQSRIDAVDKGSRDRDSDIQSQIQAFKSQFDDHEQQNTDKFNELEQMIRDLRDNCATKDDLSKLKEMVDEIQNRKPASVETKIIERTVKEEYPVREPAPRGEDPNALREIKARLDEHEQRITKLENQPEINVDSLLEQIRKLQADIQSRPDRDMIERLFEKFKKSLNELADAINQKDNGSDKANYATKKDLKRLEKMIKSIKVEFGETAAAAKNSKCLSCGRGFRTVAGLIPDSETAAILGVAPISHVCDGVNKPCFVYGSDHELYYSSSPRGKTFVASGTRSDPKRDKKSLTK